MRQFYQSVMGAICSHTGFSEAEILHDRHEIITDARHLLIQLLREKLTNQEIVHLTSLPKQTVSRLLNGYRMRCKQKYSLRRMEEEVRRGMKSEE